MSTHNTDKQHALERIIKKYTTLQSSYREVAETTFKNIAVINVELWRLRRGTHNGLGFTGQDGRSYYETPLYYSSDILPHKHFELLSETVHLLFPTAKPDRGKTLRERWHVNNFYDNKRTLGFVVDNAHFILYSKHNWWFLRCTLPRDDLDEQEDSDHDTIAPNEEEEEEWNDDDDNDPFLFYGQMDANAPNHDDRQTPRMRSLMHIVKTLGKRLDVLEKQTVHYTRERSSTLQRSQAS